MSVIVLPWHSSTPSTEVCSFQHSGAHAVREAIVPQQLAGLVFVAADATLLAAAAAEGLPIDNPLQHA
jgi:hypothetical protein